jgi:hypothetical protein
MLTIRLKGHSDASDLEGGQVSSALLVGYRDAEVWHEKGLSKNDERHPFLANDFAA